MSRIFIRHGEAIHNTDERYYQYGDDTLLTLTPKGFQDAVNYVPKLARHLNERRENNKTFMEFRISCSDSIRAKQTASIIHHEMISGPHAREFLMAVQDRGEYFDELLQYRPYETPLLREFFYDRTRERYADVSVLSGGFNYQEFQKSIDYQRGVSVSFRSLVAILDQWLYNSRQNRDSYFNPVCYNPKAPAGAYDRNSGSLLHINVSHHYAIAAAVAASLVQARFGQQQNDRIMKVCQDTYIHKGLVYDLTDLDIGNEEIPQARNMKPVPSALWAGLIAAGIEECYPVFSENKECARLFHDTYGDLPERYKPKNRVSEN